MAASLRRLCLPILLAMGLATGVGQTASAHPGHGSHQAGGHSHDHGHSHGHAHGDSGAEAESAEATGAPLGVLALFGLLIAGASLAGGAIPGRWRMTHLQFELLISLIGGLMLGVAVLHLFVHAVHEAGAGAINALAWSLLLGMLVMFLLLRAFHVHCHDMGEEAEGHVHHGDCQHSHPHAGEGVANRWGWAGLFFGLGLHTLLDGVALAIAMKAESGHESALPGLGTFLAVALHKPVDAMSIATLMKAGGWSSRSRTIANVCFAMLAPAAAFATVLGLASMGSLSGYWLGCGLAASAGVFLCIALADLLPEMQFHAHNRWRLTAALLAGVALAWGIQFLEPAHLH